jgi:hypothetical protein
VQEDKEASESPPCYYIALKLRGRFGIMRNFSFVLFGKYFRVMKLRRMSRGWLRFTCRKPGNAG